MVSPVSYCGMCLEGVLNQNFMCGLKNGLIHFNFKMIAAKIEADLKKKNAY